MTKPRDLCKEVDDLHMKVNDLERQVNFRKDCENISERMREWFGTKGPLRNVPVVICPQCRGSGTKVTGRVGVLCKTCSGLGRMEARKVVNCRACKDTGVVTATLSSGVKMPMACGDCSTYDEKARGSQLPGAEPGKIISEKDKTYTQAEYDKLVFELGKAEGKLAFYAAAETNVANGLADGRKKLDAAITFIKSAMAEGKLCPNQAVFDLEGKASTLGLFLEQLK